MADRESILLVSGLPQLEILCPGEESNPSRMIRESEEGIKPKQNKNIVLVELNRP